MSTGNTKIILVDHDRFPLLQQTATIACSGHFTGNTFVLSKKMDIFYSCIHLLLYLSSAFFGSKNVCPFHILDLTLSLLFTFSTSPLKPLNGIQHNLTGSNISTSSTKFVFFGPIGKTRWPPWPLIG